MVWPANGGRNFKQAEKIDRLRIVAPAFSTINSGTAVTDTDCSSIYSPKALNRACA